MNDCMTQGDAMNMNNEQAVSILIPLRDMMRDQYGCPISDAYFALDKAIEALAQPEHRWIPCSERLPEEEVDVLCCRDNKTMAIMHFNPVLTTRYPKGFSVVKDAFSWRQDNVIAWMPLPEPYKEGEQE